MRNVFLWHFDWPVSNGSAIHCSLMALERWLYEQIERGENIDLGSPGFSLKANPWPFADSCSMSESAIHRCSPVS